MKLNKNHVITVFLCALFGLVSVSFAENTTTLPAGQHLLQAKNRPSLIPSPPKVGVKGYVIMDAQSGHIIAEKNMNKRMPPASLTKLMTMYVISEALNNGRITLDDKVRVSKNAWHMKGSSMFLNVNDVVPVKDLIKGIIVVSGNDACVAMAEYIAGTEESFVDLMNQEAQSIGMENTHYTDATGMPHQQHYSTPLDIAKLARAIIINYPDDYKWYSDKWFKYRKIRQPNRNRLLWRDAEVDGMKTGHTSQAGYCLVASGKRNGMRLITVVMGADSDNGRTSASQALLNFGFRFYETHELYTAQKPIKNIRVWGGVLKNLPVGLQRNLAVTIPSGEYKQLVAKVDIQPEIHAPLRAGDQVGSVKITLKGNEIESQPLIALKDDPKAGLWGRMTDAIGLTFHKLFNS